MQKKRTKRVERGPVFADKGVYSLDKTPFRPPKALVLPALRFVFQCRDAIAGKDGAFGAALFLFEIIL